MSEDKQEVQQEQKPEGLMAEEAQNLKEENLNAEEEGISPQKNEAVTEGEDLENVKLEKPNGLPDKFWNEKDGADFENLIKSYNSLEKKLSEGKPKVPDQYDITSLENVSSDDPLLKTYMDWAKENGISQDNFITLASKFVELGGNIQKQEEIEVQKEREKLGPNASEIIKSNINWGKSMVTKNVFTQEDYDELEVLGGTANGQRLIQKFRQLQGEQEIPVVSIPGNSLDKEELSAMVADPRYQTDANYRRKVEKAFEEAIPN
tara:strand:- start:8068 stop:8856 length:789 start_codon:yes stop_codon:yes gene_type:complete